MKGISFILIIALIAALLVGCSSGQKQAPKENTPSQPAATQTAVKDAPQEDLEDIEEDEVDELDDEPGIRFNLGETGRNLSLPDNYPKEVLPLPEDANVVNVNADDRAIGVIFETGKSFEEAVEYCKDLMKDGSIIVEEKKEDSYLLIGTKDNYDITISVSKHFSVSILFGISSK